MVDVEDLESILIKEKNKKLKEKYSTEKGRWDEFNELALKYNCPDLVRKPYLKNKPLNQTLWKKIYITPQLELQKDIIMEEQLRNACKVLLLAMLYPFLVVLIIGLLTIS